MTKSMKYSEQFKLEAVKLVVEHGYSRSQAAKKIGVHATTLGKWVHEIHDSFQNDGTIILPTATDELIQLRKENKRLKEEHEILKKAAAFFAKESL